MIKLEFDQWSSIADLVSEDIPFVTISMLYQRKIDGNIWVDNLTKPNTVIAAFAKDAYAMGNLTAPSAQAVLGQLSSGMPETPGLRQALQTAWGTFSVTPLILHAHQSLTPTPVVPEGYQVELINPDNIALVQDFWKEDHPKDTIGDFIDIRDFLYHGFGACIVHTESGLCVSACAAISVSKERCDFGLDTLTAHEGLGLATACSHAAVGEALRRNKRPVWVTESDQSRFSTGGTENRLC